jgi:hypothetical protein
MEENLQIRLATPDDVHEVMKVALAACDENAFLDARQDLLLQEIWPALNLDHGLCPVIGPPNGEIQGLVLLRTGKIWYSDATVLEERAVFVYPKYRSAKGGRAAKLCAFSKKAAEQLGLPLVIGVLSNSRTIGKVKMYTRIFGEPAGAFFLFNAKTGGHAVT